MDYLTGLSGDNSKLSSLFPEEEGTLFGDPFGTKRNQPGFQEEQSIVQRLLKEDKPKTAAEMAADAVPDKEGKEGEKGDAVPWIQKSGWVQRLLQGLPDALAVAASNRPGEALANIIQRRQAYLIEQQRQQAQAEERKETKEYREKTLGIEGRRLEIEENKVKQSGEQFDKTLTFQQEKEANDQALALMNYDLAASKQIDEKAYREATIKQGYLQMLSSSANQKWIAEYTANAAMERERVRGANQIGFLNAQNNLRTAAEREGLKRGTQRTMMYAGATVTQANEITEKMLAGVDLSEAEQAIFDNSMAMEFNGDSTQKTMSTLYSSIVKELYKPKYDYLGKQLPFPDEKEVLEVLKGASSAMGAAMGGRTSLTSGANPAQVIGQQQGSSFDRLRESWDELLQSDPTTALEVLEKGVEAGDWTQEQADSLKISPEEQSINKQKTFKPGMRYSPTQQGEPPIKTPETLTYPWELLMGKKKPTNL